MAQFTFHLIGNAHLDPVWLWDWREGLNEGAITSRTILDLMDENPDLTCIRGEAVIYDHLERHDPATFARIQQYAAAGRWDVVGGTWLQPDTNLPATETFARHFLHGQQYFRSRFGKAPEIAWAADSFGHTAGLPEILHAAGMKGIAFTRTGTVVPAKPAFWWESQGGSRVLAYRPPTGWYGSERGEMLPRLDAVLASAAQAGLHHVGLFYGLGDHGGGPTRRHLRELAEWGARHPEVQLKHSGLHGLFAGLFAELAGKGADFLPTQRGELNFCLRGCYSSVAKLKYAYRRAEAAVMRAETTSTLLAAALPAPVAPTAAPAAGCGLRDAWTTVLFNSFHDILPGSSIERAFDDQLAWLGGALHQSQRAEHAALNVLAHRVDTRRRREPQGDHPGSIAFLVWNPHPWDYRGPVELEGSLDYRPIWPYRDRVHEVPVALRDASGTAVPFQIVATEHSSMVNLPWRKRVVVQASVPAWGWTVYELAWEEGALPVAAPADAPPAQASGKRSITNGRYTIAVPRGAKGIRITRDGQPLFTGDGMSLLTFEDPWGSWGGMGEEPDAIGVNAVRLAWKVDRVEVIEPGPERAVLAVRLTGGNSRIDLHLALYRDRDAVDVSARLFWDERSARVKLVLPLGATTADFEVPGAVVTRPATGEVPGGRWVRATGPAGPLLFTSDALYNFDLKDGALRATIARASRYANDVRTEVDEDVWRPVVDSGELKFRFVLSGAATPPNRLARELEQPLLVATTPCSAGDLPRHGSFGRLTPAALQVLACKPAEDGRGWILRVQETEGKAVGNATLELAGHPLALGPVRAWQVATWRLLAQGNGWQAQPERLTE